MALSNITVTPQELGTRIGKFLYWRFYVTLTSSGAAETLTLAQIASGTGVTRMTLVGLFVGVGTASVLPTLAADRQSVSATLASGTYNIEIHALP